MDKCNDYWKNCVNWLVRCEVLRPDHQTLEDSAHIEDLAYTLKDGVLLCNLANALDPDCIVMQNVNLNPQTIKCLCIQNIDIFLKACQDVFSMRPQDLFEPSMLYDLTGFYQVLLTLSILSNTSKALRRTSLGFSVPSSASGESVNKLSIREVDVRHSLHLSENASLSTHRESLRQDAIYEKLVTIREVLSAHHTRKKEKRDFIIEEIISNEKSYLQGVLKTVLESYMKPLQTILSTYDTKAIFGDMEKLAELHEDFYQDVLKSSSPDSDLMLGNVFLKNYQGFLIYGDYCANLPRAQELLKSISSNKVDVRDMLNTCQAQMKNGRFYLRDMLVVPMHHVLKYRLLLERLIKETSTNHPDINTLQKAYEAMNDVNSYVNEVKRDREALHTIEKIESRIIDLQMPGNKTLKNFGHLHKDDELRIKFSDQKVGNRYVFIFDQVMLICKTPKDGIYACQEALNLASYRVQDMQVSSRWGHHWRLIHKTDNIEYVIHARNEEHKRTWMQAILEALDNIEPAAAKAHGHSFVMCTVEKPTMCEFCEKSLKGLIMQGYSCHFCKLVVHKMCLKEVGPCTATFQICKQQTELPPPPYGEITNWNDYRYLGQYPWFAGKVHRKDADRMLQRKKRGTFMLRVRPKYCHTVGTSGRTEYAISLQTATAVVAHMLVFKKVSNGAQLYYLSEARFFPTLVELVDFYRNWPLQENYDQLDEILTLPYKTDSAAGASSENVNIAGEEADDENADYLDMGRAEERKEISHDPKHAILNYLADVSATDFQNQHYNRQFSSDTVDESNAQYENVTIQSTRRKTKLSYGYDTEDDSNASVSISQDYDDAQLDSPTKTKYSSTVVVNSSVQTENYCVQGMSEEDIEKFGEYIVAALKLFKNPNTLRNLTNQIRRCINDRLDSEH